MKVIPQYQKRAPGTTDLATIEDQRSRNRANGPEEVGDTRSSFLVPPDAPSHPLSSSSFPVSYSPPATQRRTIRLYKEIKHFTSLLGALLLVVLLLASAIERRLGSARFRLNRGRKPGVRLGVTRHVHCSSCDSTDIWRSKRHGIDYLFSLVGVYPYRCRHCLKRWYHFGRRLAKRK